VNFNDFVRHEFKVLKKFLSQASLISHQILLAINFYQKIYLIIFNIKKSLRRETYVV